MRVINVKFIDKSNVGDCSCSPCSYFPIKAEEVNIFRAKNLASDDFIILGGGACLDFAYKADVIWGAGMTNKTTNQPMPPEWIKWSKLIGIRDYIPGYRWLPCVSCMSPLFDREYEVKHDEVCYMNAVMKFDPQGKPFLYNSVKTMEEAVGFLGSAKKVITNSYHGIFWSKLLGREVEVVEAYSSKFHQFKPEFSLEECREANLKFWEEFKNLLPLSSA